MNKIDKIAEEISELVPILVRHMYPFVFQPIDLPPSQVLALSTLYEKGSCRLTVLSHQMHNSPPTMSGIIDRLQKAGYVRREPSFEDRRVVNILLTPKGVKIARQFRLNIMRRWQYILSQLPKGEGENVLKVLKRITRGFIDGTIA